MKDVRKMLSEALIKICEQKPLDSVTVTEITRQAGLTRQVFYRHFVDKYDLAKYIHLHNYFHALDTIEEEAKQGPNMWANVSRIWFNEIKKNAKFYQNIYRSHSGGEFKRIVRVYIMNFYLGIVQYQCGTQIEADTIFVIQLYLIGATEKINEWILNGARRSVDELNIMLYMAMPEMLRNLIIFNEVDQDTAIRIAKEAYPD